MAINEADLIILVFDGKSGAMDQDLVKKIRTTNKKWLLAVTKCDHQVAIDNVNIYSHLSKPWPVSGTTRLGVKPILAEIKNLLPETEQDEKTDCDLTISICGRPNVGKSTLYNRLLKEERSVVSDHSGTTRDAIRTNMQYKGVKIDFYDTAGIRRKKQVNEYVEKHSIIKSLQSINCADIIIFLIDIVEGVTEQDKRLIGHIIELGKGLIIAINKADTKQIGNDIYSKEKLSKQLSFIHFAPVIRISAKNGFGVNKNFT